MTSSSKNGPDVYIVGGMLHKLHVDALTGHTSQLCTLSEVFILPIAVSTGHACHGSRKVGRVTEDSPAMLLLGTAQMPSY